MKLIGSIVNERMALVGFMVEASEGALGGIRTDRAVKIPMSTQQIIKMNLNNSQVYVKDGKIIEKDGFKINELPMYMHTNDGNIIEVSNEIALLSRVVHENKLVGFRVALADREAYFRYEDVIKLSRWFKPFNFIVRYTDNGAYIAGKPGVLRLEDLPKEELVKNQKKEGKKAKGSVVTTVKKREVSDIQPVEDLVGLYKLIKSHEGIVVRLPNEEYKAIKKADRKVGEEFIELKVGEIGEPKIDFGEKNLNANTLFKKVGTVVVPLPNGGTFPVYSYVWSRKSIFVNGENHMKHFAVGVNASGAEQVRKELGNNLVVKEIADEHVLKPIRQLVGDPTLVLFEVDTSKLSIINKDKAAKYLLKNSDIYNLTLTLNRMKVYRKFLKGLLSDIEKQAKEKGIDLFEGRKLFGLFEGLSEQYLNAIKEAGIDIYTGAYKKTVKTEEKGESDEENEDGVKLIEIEYAISGMSSLQKISYNNLVKALVSGEDIKELGDIMDLIKKTYAAVRGSNDLKGTYQHLEGYLDKVEDGILNTKKKLYVHKLAMYYNYGTIHAHDREYWEEQKVTKAGNVVYACKEPGCDSLYVKVSGIKM
jgi:hypothetical protein